MANNPRLSILIPLLFLIILIFFVDDGVWAFGAGNIPRCTYRCSPIEYSLTSPDSDPSFAYMEGRAFRHGDIVGDLILWIGISISMRVMPNRKMYSQTS